MAWRNVVEVFTLVLSVFIGDECAEAQTAVPVNSHGFVYAATPLAASSGGYAQSLLTKTIPDEPDPIRTESSAGMT